MGDIVDFFNSREHYKPTKEELERMKEETYYLVKFEYSDSNITIDGFALLNEKDKEFFDSLAPKENERFYLVSDSCAECIEIEFQDYEEWRSHYTWTTITEKERCTINFLIGDKCGYFFYPEVEEDE